MGLYHARTLALLRVSRESSRKDGRNAEDNGLICFYRRRFNISRNFTTSFQLQHHFLHHIHCFCWLGHSGHWPRPHFAAGNSINSWTRRSNPTPNKEEDTDASIRTSPDQP